MSEQVLQPKEIFKCLMQFFWYCLVAISQCYNFSRHLSLVGKTFKKSFKGKKAQFDLSQNIMFHYENVHRHKQQKSQPPYAPALSPSDHHLFLSLQNHHEGRVLETHKKTCDNKRVNQVFEKEVTFTVLIVKKANQNYDWVYFSKALKYGYFPPCLPVSTNCNLSQPSKRMLLQIRGRFLILHVVRKQLGIMIQGYRFFCPF